MKITKYVTYETTNYSSFKRINGNRDLSENNVKGIIKNVQKNGLKPTIVIVNEKMEIIDGQHRVEAMKRLGLPVYFQIHKGLDLKDCIAMNTNAKTWASLDYVDSYSELENEDYLELKRLSELYPEFTYNNIITIINACTTGSLSKIIKNGELELRYKGKEAEERLDYVKKLKPYFSNVTGRRECLFSTLSRTMDLPLVDKSRLEEQIIKYGLMMKDIVDMKGCLTQLEDIYNYRKATKVRFISLYFETYEDHYSKKA